MCRIKPNLTGGIFLPYVAVMNPLLLEIEAFMETHGFSHWQFGESAMNDKHFVEDLRNGRDIRQSTVRRVRDYMRGYRKVA